jgi:hypothetical protein
MSESRSSSLASHHAPQKDIVKTVPYSNEYWEATYQEQLKWLGSNPPSFWYEVNKATRKYLGLKEKPNEEPKTAIASTWEFFNAVHNLQKLRIAFHNPKRDYPLGSKSEQQLILEMIW